jgi:hypothetical protein
MKSVRRHQFPYSYNYRLMLEWLAENIQENYNSDGSKYNSSSVSQFVEWRSKDCNSWLLRVAGNPPKIYVEIIDEEKEILFLLRFQ